MRVSRVSLEGELASVFSGERLRDPFPVWSALASSESPAIRSDGRVIVGRFEAVKAILRNGTSFSSRHKEGVRADVIDAKLAPETRARRRELVEFDRLLMSRNDEPAHRRIRATVGNLFTPASVGEIEAEISGFAASVLSEHCSSSVVDMKWVAQDLALRVMSHVIGTPQMDRQHVADLNNRIVKWIDSENADVISDAHAARNELTEYIRDVIISDYHRTGFTSPLVAAMMSAQDAGMLDEAEIVAMISLLLSGGLETTAILLTSGWLAFVENPAQWDLVCSGQIEVADAVEELLRFVSPAQFAERVAIADMDLYGIGVRRGETVVASIAAAHRDRSAFAGADELDVTRPTGRHLGLGFGPHACLGAALIRLEAKQFFGALASASMRFELACSAADLEWCGPPKLRTLRSLPLRRIEGPTSSKVEGLTRAK